MTMPTYDELNEMIDNVAELAKFDDASILRAIKNNNKGVQAITDFIYPYHPYYGTVQPKSWDGFKTFHKNENGANGFRYKTNLDFLDSMSIVLEKIYHMSSDEDDIINGIQDDTQDLTDTKDFFYWSRKLVSYMDTYEDIGTLTEPMQTAVAECMRMMTRLFLIVLLAYKQGSMAMTQTLMKDYINEHDYDVKMQMIDQNLSSEVKSLCENNSKIVKAEMDGLLNKN